MKIFEIKHLVTGKLLFKFETRSLKLCVEAAVSASTDLRDAYLRVANLRDADLQGADLRSADLQGADLRGADLQGADLQGADLQGAYLQGADLRGAYLQGAYLRSADLQGADLRGADLQGADLRSADLQGAYLQGADLRGAYLQGAYLQGAYLRDGTEIKDTPIQVIGGHYDVIIFDEHMKIGCEFHPIKSWLSYKTERIAEMDGSTALKYWKAWKKPLKALCRANGRGL